MIKPSLQNKLQSLVEHYEEIEHLLSDQKTISDQERFRALSKEHAQLAPLVDCFQTYQHNINAIQQAKILSADSDSQLRELALDEIHALETQQQALEEELTRLLLPQDPNDQRNIFLEIRAAAGGDESALFSGDLLRMYTHYAESQGWGVEILLASHGEHGGYKAVTTQIVGKDVYSRLKFESGAHRVQRVPTTESQGRIHTSTCTVAVLPEADEIDEIVINPADLKIDTYRASGAGGQHVNKTESAIRITHLPSGIIVECQDERSQHKNRARAMSILKAKLLSEQQAKQQREIAENRRNLVGTGDRSERIRTYNFPQGRITDHRINLTLYKLEEVLEGNLSLIIEPLLKEHQADLLAASTEESI